MSVCILIAGLPASGKSTFARMLMHSLGIPCLSKDSIKESLFDTLGFQSRAEKVKLGEAAYRIMLDQAEALLRNGLNIALENNFEDVSCPPLLEMLERTGTKPITVLFDGDIAAIHTRFLQRDQSPERHRGHVVNTRYPETETAPYVPLSPEAFAAGMEARGYRRFDIGGARLVVDTTQTCSVDWANVLDWIQKQIEKER